MAGAGTISVNQTPQYGDKTALESASKGMTETPMTGTPTPAPTAGRPVSSGGGVSQTGNADDTGNTIPPAHQEAAADVARKAWAAQFWADLAGRPDAGPRTKMYAQIAQRSLQAAMMDARNRTPYFEE
jgi:hypothetical protein